MDACTMAADMTWGNFQSLIQLSAGLNAAFYALMDLLQPDVAMEGRRLKVLISALRRRADKDVSFRPDLTAARLLSGKLKDIDRRYAAVARRLFRPACVIAFLEAVVLLFVSSYLYDDTLSLWEVGFIIVSVIPFLLAIFIAMVAYFCMYLSVTRTRLRITKKLKAGALRNGSAHGG